MPSAIAEKRAWARYLDDTRNLNGLTYEEVEPTAWHRLQRVLAKPKPIMKRKKVGVA